MQARWRQTPSCRTDDHPRRRPRDEKIRRPTRLVHVDVSHTTTARQPQVETMSKTPGQRPTKLNKNGKVGLLRRGACAWRSDPPPTHRLYSSTTGGGLGKPYGMGSPKHAVLLSPPADLRLWPWGSGAPPTKVYGLALFVRSVCLCVQSEIVQTPRWRN